MGHWDYYDYYRPSKPVAVKGGIKSQSTRGAFGTSWWAKRWISVLEGFYDGARLSRGRSYARGGQVLSIDIDKGKVSAKVQGSRPTPYKVLIEIKTLSAEQWKRLAEVLSKQAIFAAKLLAGDMPQDIETAFTDAGLSLFPSSLKDLDTDCSCPDWSNPCKHIAAVHYLLGEEFDRDPFLIFKLRGINREELMDLLGGSITQGQAASPASLFAHLASAAEQTAPQPLEADPARFWDGPQLPDDFFGETRTPTVSAAMLKQLGSLPFWRAEERLLDALEPIYEKASSRGISVFAQSK